MVEKEGNRLELLPSMQVAQPFSVRGDGRRVLLTPAGCLVCEHGETRGTISYWLSQEAKAKAQGRPPPPRGGLLGPSICDCRSTDGLRWKVANTCRPVAPPSLFEFLERQGTPEIDVKGVPARQIPHVAGPAFVTATGKVVCKHGRSRAALHPPPSKQRKSCAVKCDCAIGKVQRPPGMTLGKWSAKRVRL